jgi:thiamine monophosphate synthase
VALSSLPSLIRPAMPPTVALGGIMASQRVSAALLAGAGSVFVIRWPPVRYARAFR